MKCGRTSEIAKPSVVSEEFALVYHRVVCFRVYTTYGVMVGRRDLTPSFAGFLKDKLIGSKRLVSMPDR